MQKPKIGLQLYNLREYTKSDKDIDITLRKVKEIGYDVVQVSGMKEIEADILKEMLDRYGLYACSAHIPYEKLINNTEEWVKYSKKIGYHNVACPYLSEDFRTPEKYKEVAMALSKAGKVFYDNGILLCYHNHGFELESYSGKTGLEIIYDESDPKYLYSEIDTYWIQLGGGDPAEWIAKYKNRIPIIHYKDMGIKNNKTVMKEFGLGNMNWKKILEASIGSGTEYVVYEQDDCYGADPFECARTSLNNMKKLLA
jgi:sugar phosphate isomerase/epimerase